MPRFYVNTNAQPTGEHEVHNADANCPVPPLPENRKPLGSFITCHGAVVAAQQFYSNVDGCAYCCPGCHTR